MTEVCPKCGLPKALCICETIAKESQKILVKNERRKFGKVYTVIIGIDTKEIDTREVTKRLKTKLACGGTAKDEKIELQGNHKRRVKEILTEIGFAPETIEIR